MKAAIITSTAAVGITNFQCIIIIINIPVAGLITFYTTKSITQIMLCDLKKKNKNVNYIKQ